MSLRVRLNLLITLSLVVTLIAGTLLVISRARHAVAEETRSTVNLALQMLQVVMSGRTAENDPLPRVVEHLRRFEKTRHLHIEGIDPDDKPSMHAAPSASRATAAPHWFARLVRPDRLALWRTVLRTGGGPPRIIVTADPADEITEAWNEARALLALLVLMAVIANGLVYFSLGRSLKPIHGILQALERIEQGDYHSRLPESGVAELYAIAHKFNHMAGVLEQSREQNRQLAQRALAIQEQERRYLAQELHDELGQSVSAIQALAVAIAQTPGLQARVVETAQTISGTTRRIYDVVRNLMRSLRPVLLDELGLRPALQHLTDEWNERHEDVFCEIRISGELELLSEEMQIHTYRIVQEALTNVTKHARANAVRVSVTYEAPAGGSDGGALCVSISDNGIGLPAPLPGGLGLSGMRERAEALGGSFTVNGRDGTRIDIRFPLTTHPPTESTPDEYRNTHPYPARR